MRFEYENKVFCMFNCCSTGKNNKYNNNDDENCIKATHASYLIFILKADLLEQKL